jgi:hypothetical protein
MLKQERKIKSNMQGGGMASSMPVQDQMAMPQPNSLMSMMSKGGVNNPGFKALPGYVQAKIRANMQYGGSLQGPMDAVAAVMAKQNTPNMPMMQMGGTMPQSTAGKSVLQEAMMMNQMQNGGKMPKEIARARFMAAAKGNATKAKETASKYGYKMQEGAMSQSVERIGEVDVNKKRSFGERVAGKYRQAKKALGMNPYQATDADQGRAAVFAQERENNAGILAASREAAATNKKQNRNQLQRVGDEFGTYLNLSGDRNVLTDLADIGTMAASAVGMNSTAAALQSGKRTVQDFGNTKVAKAIDYINPLSIGANLVAGATGTAGDVAAGENTDAMKRAGITTALAATRGIAGKVSGAAAMPVGKAFGKVGKSKLGHSIEHQLGHAGQHQLLSPLLAHKNGGTIKDMYMMKKGGQFPERYKKMGFKGVDQPKKTSSGGKSHAVVTKVDGNYKLIRFGQKGVSGSPEGSARNKAFKARHAKNIAKGKSSAAYWANKVKW